MNLENLIPQTQKIMKNLVAISIILFSSIISEAQITFSTPNNYAVGLSPYSITCSDFNGDGKPDLASANWGSNNMSVILNNGLGVFSSAMNYPTGFEPLSITHSDFNGDGKMDLAVESFNDIDGSSNRLSILIGNGLGIFAPATKFAIGGSTSYSTIGLDINNDGKSDIVTCDWVGSYSTGLGDGLGGFITTAVSITGHLSGAVTASDFNSDGKIDLAITYLDSGQVSIFLGNGIGSFSPGAIISLGPSEPWSIVSDDFNGDGKMDLATANGDSNSISVLLGNGIGGFSAPSTIAVSWYPASIVSGDFNADGFKDLATSNFTSNNVSILLGNGLGTFSAPISFPAGIGPRSIQVADFNGDGKLDLATSNRYSNDISILLNTSPTRIDETIMPNESIYIYPNPTKGEFAIEFQNQPSNASLEICNSLGAIVYKIENIRDCNSIDLSQEPNGLYFIKIMNQGTLISMQKLIKE